MKIGLALGGGSSHGLAHIGVLEALEEHRIPIHIICGTSIGALVGGYYALHPDARRLKEISREILVSKEFKGLGLDLLGETDMPNPFHSVLEFVKEQYIHTKLFLSPHIVGDDGLQWVLEKLFGDALISDTRIPFAAVAVDLVTGQDRIIREGRIFDAVRASIAIPGVFPVFEDSKGILVDGGVASTIPSVAVRELGADFVIASSLMGDLKKPGSLRTAFHINLRVDEIVKWRLNSTNLSLVDVVISPDVLDIHWADFSKFSRCLRKGREAVTEALPAIRRGMSLLGRLRRWVRDRERVKVSLPAVRQGCQYGLGVRVRVEAEDRFARSWH
jgi:NTE family protein